MAFTPITGSALQYMADNVGALDHYIKFYASGTSSPISMATDSTGGTLLVKAQFNSQGYAINGSNAEFIPHIDRKYKIVFYPDAATADANDFSSAVFEIDLLGQLATIESNIADVKNRLTLAVAVADTFLQDGDALNLAERTTGNQGGAMWDVVLLSSVTPNTFDIVVCTGVPTLALVLRIDSETSFSDFGCIDNHPTGQTANINAALAAGVMVKGQRGKTYTFENEINFPAGSIVDWNGATLKPIAAFPNTEPFTRVTGDNVLVLNLVVDGNKANLTNSFASGATGCGILIGDDIDNVTVRGGRILNCPTNGYLIFGSNMRNITFDTIITEENGFVGYGVEVESVGDVVPRDIKFLNVTSSSNALGGLRVAGCNKLFIDNCSGLNEGNSAAVFYIGDANGGLTNCKVSNSYFQTANAAADACLIDGEVRTGAEIGNRNTCDVEFNNVTFEGNGGGTALRVKAGATLRGSTISGNNTAIGFYPDTDSFVNVSDLKFTNATDRTYILDSLCYIDGLIAEFWGASVDAITLSNADNSILRKVRLGAASGETGDDGVGVTGTPVNIFLELKSFDGNGTDINVSGAILGDWDVYNLNQHRLLSFTDGVLAPPATVGSAKMFVDLGGDLKIIFGDGVIKTIVTDV